MNKTGLVLGAIAVSLHASALTHEQESNSNSSWKLYNKADVSILKNGPGRKSNSTVMRNEEEATRITSGNFTYNLYKGYYEGETFAAEIMPGWDIYDGSFDLLSIFPDGKIEIPSSVEYDGMTYKVVAISEFRWIRQMTEFIIPPTVKILRHESLEGAPIENIILPDGVTNIEYGAFRNCNNLKTVYCGKNLENVSGNAFQGCSSLDKFEIDPKNPYLETIGDFLVSKSNKEAMVYYARGKKNLVIPSGIESLAEDLCRWDEDLETVTMNEGLKVINQYVFMECPNIREITLPSTLESIEWGAFSGTAIEKLIVPDNVNWLADCVNDCPNLKRIHIGKNTSLISKYGAFHSGCGHRIGKGSNNITEITVDPENQWFTADNLGLYTKQKNTIGRIIPSLPVVNLSGTKITAIGSDAASYGNNSQIILPEHLKIIDGRPFEGTNLSEPLHIPYTMTFCNWDMTYEYRPRDIYYHSNIPHPYLAEDQNMENKGITMHVPAGRKEVFENSHSYSHFTIVDDLPEQKMNCIDFGYHGDRFQEEGIGTNGPAAEGAILIPTAQLRAYEGMQITGVNFDNSFSQSAYAFIDRLSTGERIAFQQLTPIDQSTLNHIRFDNPYTIQQGDEDLLVGIGFDDISNFPYSKIVNPVGNYWREKGQTEWTHGDPSSMTCMPTDHAWMWSVSIEGEKMPVDGRLMNVEVEEDIAAKVYRIKGFFNNMSDMTASEVELAYSFLNTEALARSPKLGVLKENGKPDGSIKIDIDAQPMLTVPFTAEIPMPESGTFVLTVDVAAINGEEDNTPENSMVYQPVEGQNPTAIDKVETSGVRISRVDQDLLRIEGAPEGSTIEIISLDGITTVKHTATGDVTEVYHPDTAPIIVKVGNLQKIIL